MDAKTFVEQTLEACKRRLYRTLRGLTPEELTWRPYSEANPMGFIVWHVAWIEDCWLTHFPQDETGGLNPGRPGASVRIA
ncbi:hypothetical protein NKDENANG_03204 [Candidatus Entotheonellaceae bacterium PAL068K]